MSLRSILNDLSLKPKDINLVALSSYYMGPPIYNRERWLKSFETAKSLSSRIKRVITNNKLYQPIAEKRRLQQRFIILKRLRFQQFKFRSVEHHLSHASAGYYSIFSKNRHSKYLILTLGGSGDGLRSTVNIGKSGKIEKIAKTPKGNSLGNIFSRVTYCLGFIPWEHEYKLMGMSPYVPKKKVEEISKIFCNYLDLDPRNPLILKN